VRREIKQSTSAGEKRGPRVRIKQVRREFLQSMSTGEKRVHFNR
jgi:hypothetical protein